MNTRIDPHSRIRGAATRAVSVLALTLIAPCVLGQTPDFVTAFQGPTEQVGAELQYDLAVRFLWGRGVIRDDAEALRWFRRAADQGHAEAQYTLGAMYSLGRGVCAYVEDGR